MRSDVVAAAVLSGNRNFEGRVNADVRANYLASPPLVVAYALAGSMQVDLDARADRPQSANGRHVFLRDIWPKSKRDHVVHAPLDLQAHCSSANTATCSRATRSGATCAWPKGDTYRWDSNSTYVQNPPYFVGISKTPAPLKDVVNARILGLFLDSITTDHISPAGSIKAASPAGKYLIEHGVDRASTSTSTAPAAAITR